ncbi:GNAT family N-acetyltransferase [Gaetbulibacter aquiaggeris]|uniref:GNAT family N-acetyltransferase n=1 Tax=Gaetbulibacter aquiaggeris TaxID=1735373 RepID=A0ABW7MQW8_9FLAO
MKKHKLISDITFVGSGISTSFSIINFLDLLDNHKKLEHKIVINIIEEYSEFNLGVPYGTRSGFSTLLITSLRNFLIEPELSLFIKWLNINRTWLLDEFEKEGGDLSKKWLLENKENIQNNNWEELFIPRRFFGCYINLRVNNKITALTENGLIAVNFIRGEVVDIEKNNSSYNIILQDKSEIETKKVILSVGSLPINYLWKNKDLIEDENLMFINNPYKPELRVVLDKIDKFIHQRANKPTNILIVGANASALELTYKINDFLNENNNTIYFTFLSTLGSTPDSVIDKKRQKEFFPSHLNSLKKEKNLTAKLIAEATFKDLDFADKINLGAASTVDIVSRYFGVLLEGLSTKELQIFATQYGNNIGKRQRCAGTHYSNVIAELKRQKRFQHISGRFKDLKLNNKNGDYSLTYLDTSTKKEKAHEVPFHIIINCVGSMNLNNKHLPLLHRNLIKKEYCIPNESRIGFHVNETLEAHKDLHVMGPMLAGNVIDNKAVWHVEHCGRIIWLSNFLSKIIYDDLINNKGHEQKEHNFKVVNLNNGHNLKEYDKLLKEHWHNNIYYTYEHLKYFRNDKNSLKYFHFKTHDSNHIIMPIILRRIESVKEGINYFDAITPYGYSGPLYTKNIDEIDLKAFWKEVDNWYKNNHIVTEFIRFSLNNNHKGYNGLLISTLLNVTGKLPSEFEKQWHIFLPKVRNNYRKAQSYNLLFKIFNDNDITDNIIVDFYEIYTRTMLRNNAKSIYFFPLDYFKNLILNNISNFVIAFAYVEDVPISAELIIKNKNTMFAFLGGTDAMHYDKRPNDFLRVEIIKWGINNNFKHYILGGGQKDYDGLYKSKKSFFPKEEDAIFYTGRKIIDNKAYNELCENHIENFTNTRKEELKNYFFPLYRFHNR